MNTHSSTIWVKAVLALLLLISLASIGAKVPGIDHLPLIWALRAELAGNSAYGPALDGLFGETYGPICPACVTAGFAYPLPAMWLALPVAWLPDALASVAWSVMSTSVMLCALMLLRTPRPLLLFAPLWYGILQQQATVLIVGLLLLGIWAAREQRWWPLGIIIALTVLTKPQASVLFAGMFAIQLIQHRRWLPLLLPSAVLLACTFAIEPMWLLKWIKAMQLYNQVLAPRWLIQWAALAILPIIFRRRWAALAILQVCLVPVVSTVYTLLPLLTAYVEVERRWLAWFIVSTSWIIFAFQGQISEPLILSLGYFLPFGGVILAEYLMAHQKQDNKRPPMADAPLQA